MWQNVNSYYKGNCRSFAPQLDFAGLQKRGCRPRILPSAMACIDILWGRSKPTGKKLCPKCSPSPCLSSAQGFVSLGILKDTLPVAGPVFLWTLVSFLNLQPGAASSAAYVRCWTTSFGFHQVHLALPALRLPTSCVGAGRKQPATSGAILQPNYCEEKCLASLPNSLNLAEGQAEAWPCLISFVRLEVHGTDFCKSPLQWLAFHMASY